jgi:hypothetical protein
MVLLIPDSLACRKGFTDGIELTGRRRGATVAMEAGASSMM